MRYVNVIMMDTGAVVSVPSDIARDWVENRRIADYDVAKPRPISDPTREVAPGKSDKPPRH